MKLGLRKTFQTNFVSVYSPGVGGLPYKRDEDACHLA